MKKLILVFIFFQICLFPQLNNTNKWVMRGDDVTLSFNYKVELTNDTLIFVVKASKDITAVRLIEKTTYDNEINLSGTSRSSIFIPLSAGDTDDLTLAKYFYDITRIKNGDTSTIIIGELYLQPDIGTPFDGTDVTGRVTTVSLNNGSVNRELIWWDDSLEYWAPSGITFSSGGSVGNADSLGGVPAANYMFDSDTLSLSNRINLKLNSDDTLSLSNRINLKLNSADTLNFINKTTLQNITAQKNFLGIIKFRGDTSITVGGTIGFPLGFNFDLRTANSYQIPLRFAALDANTAAWTITNGEVDFTPSVTGKDHVFNIGNNWSSSLQVPQFGQQMEAFYEMNDTTIWHEWFSYYNNLPAPSTTYSVRPFQIGTVRYGSSAPYRYTSSVNLSTDVISITDETNASLIEFRTQTYGATATQSDKWYPTVSNALGNSMMYIIDSLWIFHEKNNFGWLYQANNVNSPIELMRANNLNEVVIAPGNNTISFSNGGWKSWGNGSGSGRMGTSDIGILNNSDLRFENYYQNETRIKIDTTNITMYKPVVFNDEVTFNVPVSFDTVDANVVGSGVSNFKIADDSVIIKSPRLHIKDINGDLGMTLSSASGGNATIAAPSILTFDTQNAWIRSANGSTIYHIFSGADYTAGSTTGSGTGSIFSSKYYWGLNGTTNIWLSQITGTSLVFQKYDDGINPTTKLTIDSAYVSTDSLVTNAINTQALYINGILQTGDGSVGNADSLGSVPASGYLLKSDSTGANGYATQYDLTQITGGTDSATVISLVHDVLDSLNETSGYYVSKVENFNASATPMVINPQDSGDVLMLIIGGQIPASWNEFTHYIVYDANNLINANSVIANNNEYVTYSYYLTVDDTDDVNFGIYNDDLASWADYQSATVITLKRNTIRTYVDTLSYSINVPDTVTTGTVALWKIPDDITIIEIAGCTDANTSTFNIEERGETTPNTAGTDVMGSDLVADTDQQETASFTNANIAKDNWLALTVSATGDVALLSVNIRYVKQ